MIVLSRCHDQNHRGAKTPEGLTEWVAGLDVCLGAASYLKKYGHLALTMAKGTLKSRIKAINDMGRIARCAIEPHFNSISDNRIHGCSVICWHTSKEGERLAYHICEAIEETGLRYRGVNLVSSTKRWIGSSKEYRDKRLAFIEDLDCLSVIPEICYFSNEDDAKFISEHQNRHWVGVKIGEGVMRYLKEIENA